MPYSNDHSFSVTFLLKMCPNGCGKEPWSRFHVKCDQKGSEERQFDMLCGYEHDKNGDAGESSLE